MTAEKKKGGLRKYVAYGTGFLGDALYYQFISSYLLVFLTGAVGMSPKDAGTVGSIIVLADAAGSLFVGRFTDGLKCRYGRRRPVLLFSAFVLPLLFCLLFITVPGTDPQRVVYRVVPHMGHASDPLYAESVLEEIEIWMAAQLDR